MHQSVQCHYLATDVTRDAAVVSLRVITREKCRIIMQRITYISYHDASCCYFVIIV